MSATGGTRTSDVLVVGAGVIGLSIAYHLAELGAAVVVLDRAGIAAGASGVQPGGVRAQWAVRESCLLAQESLRFYRELGERLGTRLRPRFTACGYAFVAHSDERLGELTEAVALQNELGIPSQILSPEATAAAVSELDPGSIRGASWCAEDGYFDRAQEPVEAFAEAAQARGVEIRIEEVLGLEADGAGWRVRTRSGADLTAGGIVVAAAGESRAILIGVGFDVPLRPERRFLFLSDPIGERLLEPLVVATELAFAAKQLANGRVLASDLHAEGDPATGVGRWRRTVHAGIETLLPRLQMVALPHLVSGVYDVSPDNLPFLGQVPDVNSVWLAAGFSGHGFMIAPAVGRLVADAVTGSPDPLLAAFRLDRSGGSTETHIV